MFHSLLLKDLLRWSSELVLQLVSFVGCIFVMDCFQLINYHVWLLILILFLFNNLHCIMCFARRHCLIPCLIGTFSGVLSQKIMFVNGGFDIKAGSIILCIDSNADLASLSAISLPSTPVCAAIFMNLI